MKPVQLLLTQVRRCQVVRVLQYFHRGLLWVRGVERVLTKQKTKQKNKKQKEQTNKVNIEMSFKPTCSEQL